MGCKCTKYNPQDENQQIEANKSLSNFAENDNKGIKKDITNDNHIIKNNTTNLPTDCTYAKDIIEKINAIRADPQGFADIILNKKENITVEKDKIVYKQKVKVALFRGEEGFDEAAAVLKELKPLPPLILNDDICVPFPDDEELAKNKIYLEQEVRRIEKEQNIQIDTFYKELVKIPEVSALLMIVDDSGKNTGKKRNALLSKDFKYIGISSRFYRKTFIAYFTFA